MPPRKQDPPKETGSSGAQTRSCWKRTCAPGGSRAPFTCGRARRTPKQQGEWTDPTQGLAGGKVTPNRGNSKETNQAALGGVVSQSPGFLPEGQVTLGLHVLILGSRGPSRARAARCPGWPPAAQAETPRGGLGGSQANLDSPPKESRDPPAKGPLPPPIRKPPFTHSQHDWPLPVLTTPLVTGWKKKT